MWQSIPLYELKTLIAQQIAECSPETRMLFEANAITPQKWTLSPWGDDGGGFWVIAIIGKFVLWYNDMRKASIHHRLPKRELSNSIGAIKTHYM